MFWAFHDRLFASDLPDADDTMLRLADEIGLDIDRFEDDRTAPATRAKVRRDIEQGTSLGVDGTPTVFLNDRRAQRISLPVLELLINDVLSNNH